MVEYYALGKESNNLRFSAPKGLFSKPRPYTYQVGFRLTNSANVDIDGVEFFLKQTLLCQY